MYPGLPSNMMQGSTTPDSNHSRKPLEKKMAEFPQYDAQRFPDILFIINNDRTIIFHEAKVTGINIRNLT